ncbi:hypothetical protein Trydic_g22565 [Trypoxylus dichotomus]
MELKKRWGNDVEFSTGMPNSPVKKNYVGAEKDILGSWSRYVVTNFEKIENCLLVSTVIEKVPGGVTMPLIENSTRLSAGLQTPFRLRGARTILHCMESPALHLEYYSHWASSAGEIVDYLYNLFGRYDNWKTVNIPKVLQQFDPWIAETLKSKRLFQQVSSAKLALTGMNFFTVTRGLVLNIAAAVVTYEIFFIQYINTIEDEN